MGKLMGFFKSRDDATAEEPRARKPSSTRKVPQSKENANQDIYETTPDLPPPYLTVPSFPPSLYEPGYRRYRPGVIVTRDKCTGHVRADWVSAEAEQFVQPIYRNAPPEDYANERVRLFTSTLRSSSMAPTPPPQRRRLPHPVFIPQRKPEHRGPGWMTAYPPVLDDCGIDEKTFLSFLEDFNEICESSPHFDAINLATMDVTSEPGTTPTVVSIDVPAAVHYAQATQAEQQKSLFLSLANAQLFSLLGLFALVTIFRPSQPSSPVVQADISSRPIRTAQGGPSRRAPSAPRGACPAATTYTVRGTRGRALKPELLYLMVVPQPTDEELAADAAAHSYNTSATARTRMSPESLPQIDTLQIVPEMRDERQEGD